MGTVGVLFSTDNAKGAALNNVYPEDRNKNPQYFCPENTMNTEQHPDIGLRCFVVRQFLSQIYALFGVQFKTLRIALAYKKITNKREDCGLLKIEDLPKKHLRQRARYQI